MKDKYPIINSVDNIQRGYVIYPPCSKCYEPDKEPGGGLVDGIPVCAKCYIEAETREEKE